MNPRPQWHKHVPFACGPPQDVRACARAHACACVHARACACAHIAQGDRIRVVQRLAHRHNRHAHGLAVERRDYAHKATEVDYPPSLGQDRFRGLKGDAKVELLLRAPCCGCALCRCLPVLWRASVLLLRAQAAASSSASRPTHPMALAALPQQRARRPGLLALSRSPAAGASARHALVGASLLAPHAHCAARSRPRDAARAAAHARTRASGGRTSRVEKGAKATADEHDRSHATTARRHRRAIRPDTFGLSESLRATASLQSQQGPVTRGKRHGTANGLQNVQPMVRSAVIGSGR